MRIAVERESGRRREGPEAKHAATEVGPPSSDPARQALAAARIALAGKGRASVDAAVQSLATRAQDPARDDQVIDDTDLDQELPIGPALANASPARQPPSEAARSGASKRPGDALPGDEGRIDDKDQEPDWVDRLHSLRVRLSRLRAELGRDGEPRPPETWLLASALEELVSAIREEDSAGGEGAKSEVDHANLPSVAAADRRPQEDTSDLNRASGAGRGAESPKQRQEQAEAKRLEKRTTDANKVLARGPSEGKPARPPKDGKAQAETNAKGKAASRLRKPVAGPAPEAYVKVQPAGAGSGGSASVAAWKGRLAAKTGAVTAKDVPDADRYVVTFQAASEKAQQDSDEKNRRLLAEAMHDQIVTPVTSYNQGQEDAFQLPADPMPDARRDVDAWIDKKIRKQDLPPLRRSPLNSMPQLGLSTYEKDGEKHVMRELSPGRYGEIHVVAPGEKPPAQLGKYDEVWKAEKAEGKGSLAERLRAVNANQPRNLKPPQIEPRDVSVTDDMPLRPPKVPQLQGREYQKIDTAKVLEIALAGSEKYSRQILVDTVKGFPGGDGVPTGYIDDWGPEVKADVVAELDKIRTAGSVGGGALKDKLAAEKDKVEQEVTSAHEKVKNAKLEAKAGCRTAYEAVSDEISAIRDDLDRRAEDQAAIAKGGTEAKDIKEKKAKYLKANTDKVETWLGHYEAMRKRRKDQLDAAEVGQTNAYHACAELDRKQVLAPNDKEKDKDPAKTEVAALIEQINQWETDVLTGSLDANVKGVAPLFKQLRLDADTDIDEFVENLKREGENYKKAVEQWARDRLGIERSFWAKLIDFLLDWLHLAKKQSKAWQIRSEEDNTAHLAEDEIWLREFQIDHHNKLTQEQLDAMEGLSEEKRAILQSFFIDKQGDGATALAAGLMARLNTQLRSRLQPRLEERILKDSWPVIIAVADHTGGFRTEKVVADLHAAFTGPGTKKQDVYKALGGLTKIQARAVEFQYELTYGIPLRYEISSELNDVIDVAFYGSQDADHALALLETSKSQADAADKSRSRLDPGEIDAVAVQLDQTMHGTFLHGAGTNEQGLLDLLRGKNSREIAAIKRAYFVRYKRDLATDIKGELEDGFTPAWKWQEAKALLDGRTDDAEAAALRGAMGHAPKGGRIDDALINRVTRDQKAAEDAFARVQAQAARDAAEYGWDDATYKRQLGFRLQKLDDTFGTKYGGEFDALDPKKSALDIAFGKTFSADQAQMFKGIRTQNLGLESAARVSIEHKALYSDKKAVNKTLADQYNRQYDAEMRDVRVAQQKEKEQGWKDCTVKKRDAKGKVIKDRYGNDVIDEEATKKNKRAWRMAWLSPEGAEKKRKEAEASAEARARAKAPDNMERLKQTYENPEEGFISGSMFSSGSFEGDVYSATNVSWAGVKDLLGVETRSADTDKTMALMARDEKGKFVGGYLTGGQQLFFAVYGAGTSDEEVHQAYAGKSPEQIKKMHEDLQRRMDKVGVSKEWTPEAWVKDDFSGRDLDDVTVEMEFGEAVTPQEKQKRAKRRLELEKQSIKGGGVGDAILGTLLFGPLVGAKGMSMAREAMGRTEMEVMEAEVAALDDEIAELEKDKQRLREQGVEEGDAKWIETINKRYEQIGVIAESVDSALAAHRAQVDAIADWAGIGIQVIAGVASLVVGIVLTPVTGGASMAVWIAVISTLATSALTIAAKAAIKGGAYGSEEFWTDVSLAAVEAISAGLTAGLGGRMIEGLGLAKGKVDGIVAAFVKKSIGHFVTGAIQAAPGAIIGTLINDGGLMDALGQILQGGLMAVAIGTATDPITEHFQAIKAAKVRASPADFEQALKAFQKQHPNDPPEELRAKLRAHLDEAIMEGRPKAFQEPEMQKALRADLLDGLTGPQKAAMERGRIEVVKARDFAKVTGKPLVEGQPAAALAVKNGVPVLTVAAGTDLASLGKAMPHLFDDAVKISAPRPARAEPAHPRLAVGEPARPRGASGPDPRGPIEPHGATPKRVILEPFAGPSLESSLEIARANPDARVIATERSIKPDAAQIAKLEKAGGTFVGENKSPNIPMGSVDEIKLRFPIPSERTIEQDFVRHLAEVERLHPSLDRLAQHDMAMRATKHLAESLTAYGPYALERLKPGGSLEVVFHERSILGEVGDVSRMRFIDPATGKGYRLELVDIEIRPRGEVAPHSGFGIKGITNATEVRVARFEKVEIETRLPRGARGPDIAGEVVGKFSGRGFAPSEAGGPVRELDFGKIRFTDKGVDVVEHHVRRFDGGGDMELAMVDRLRRISAGEIPATDFDRAFYSHELRESVRYRNLGLREGQPLEGMEYKVWNDAHTATLEDYRLAERLPSGQRTLYHPEVTERFEPAFKGGRGPELPAGETVPRGGRGPEPPPDVGSDKKAPHSANASPQSEGGRSATRAAPEAAPSGAETAPPAEPSRPSQKFNDPAPDEANLERAGRITRKQIQMRPSLVSELSEVSGVAKKSGMALEVRDSSMRPYKPNQPCDSTAFLSADHTPVVHVATGDTVTITVPKGQEVILGSKGFFSCAAAVIRGTDGENVSLTLSHLLMESPVGQAQRLHDLVSQLSARGVKDLEVMVHVDPAAQRSRPQGTSLPDSFYTFPKTAEELQQKLREPWPEKPGHQPGTQPARRPAENLTVSEIQQKLVDSALEPEMSNVYVSRQGIEVEYPTLADSKPSLREWPARTNLTARGQTEPAPKIPPLDKSTFPDEMQKVMGAKKSDYPSELARQFEPNQEIPASFVRDATQWTASMAREMPSGEYVYIVRDPETGRILKVGVTDNKPQLDANTNPLNARMTLYRNASELTRIDAQVELHHVEVPAGTTVETYEGLLRGQLYRGTSSNADKEFDWDGKVAHNKARFGPGTPGEIPKHRDPVLITSAKDNDLAVIHRGSEVTLTVTDKTLNEVKAAASKSGVALDASGAPLKEPLKTDLPQRYLYEWRRFPDGGWALTPLGSPEGTAPVIELSPIQRIHALPSPEARRAELVRMLGERGGGRQAVDILADDLGVTPGWVLRLLRPPHVDQRIDPHDIPSSKQAKR